MNLYAVDNMRFRFLSMFCVSDVDGLNVFRHDLNRRVVSFNSQTHMDGHDDAVGIGLGKDHGHMIRAYHTLTD
jgi:hypothetical protein